MRVLLVEDDASIAVPLVSALERAGFEVTRVETGREALEEDPGDLVLLDLGLPDLDGEAVCREIRERSDVPIIVVTARAEEIERVRLLDLGADDYVVKPFGIRELLARIRAVARRSAGAPAGGPRTVEIGPVTVDVRTRRVTVNGLPVTLSPKEFDLLAFLAEDPGAVFSRDQILRSVWDENWWGSTKTLDVHVASLRKKLGDPALIETVRGVGYRMAEETSAETP